MKCPQPNCNGILHDLISREGIVETYCLMCGYPPDPTYREKRESIRKHAKHYNAAYRPRTYRMNEKDLPPELLKLTSEDWLMLSNKDLAERFGKSESWVSTKRPDYAKSYHKGHSLQATRMLQERGH